MVKPSSSSIQTGSGDVTRTPTSRPQVDGTQGIVSAGHHLTAVSAMRMLLSGGNAFDAAAAAGFTAAVVEPTASYTLATEASIMLYHAGSRQLRALSAQGVAPGGATVGFFKKRGLDKIPTGPGANAELSFTVPGAVDGFLTMLSTYGTKTLGEAAESAIDYAVRGFPMYRYMGEVLENPAHMDQFRVYPPGGAAVFYPGGDPPQVGELLVQEQLGNTIQSMVMAEQSAGGDRIAGLHAARDMFYSGDIARTIVECSNRVGGFLSLDDLAGYRAKFETPLTTTFMGHEIYGQSTWSQGAVVLQALSMLEHFDLRAMGHNSPVYVHVVTEALKLAFADREAYYGDPDYTTVPIEGLLSKQYASERAQLISWEKASPELPQAGDPWRYGNGSGMPRSNNVPLGAATSSAEGHQEGTTHFAVIDCEGNMVCVTPSGGSFTKSVFFPELGFALSTRSEMFFVDEEHPNGLRPGKRPRTTLVSYIVSKDGQPVMTSGCPGGDFQVQANLQQILNVLVFGMGPQQAVEAPRFGTQSIINSFYPRVYLPGQLAVDPGISDEVRSRLQALSHKVVEADSCGMGAVVTQRDPETGALTAGADPRRATYAIGW